MRVEPGTIIIGAITTKRGLHQLPDLRHAGRPTHHDDFVNVGRRQIEIAQQSRDGKDGAIQEGLGEDLEFGRAQAECDGAQRVAKGGNGCGGILRRATIGICGERRQTETLFRLYRGLCVAGCRRRLPRV